MTTLYRLLAREVSETLSGVTNGNRIYIYIYIYTYYKYSTLPRGISINIAPKAGIFPEGEGRGKYSLARVQERTQTNTSP